LNHYDQPEIINVGWEKDVSIRELSEIICEITGFSGKLHFDQTKPDGTPQKLLSTAKLRKLGWEPKIGLREGIRRTYQWFLENRRVASR